jgi:response regulator RpfG family c-di-GMP phosphodiesterase
LHLLLVDDDPGLRALLRTTFEGFEVSVAEAGDATEAQQRIREQRPDVIVLDVMMPGIDGLELSRRLKADPETRGIRIVLLTGSVGSIRAAADAAGADAFVAKPFSPLELLSVAERLAGGLDPVPTRSGKRRDPDEQLMIYAHDLRHLLELERAQRALLQEAYRETVSALATALESKDTGTRAHSQRVQRYALVLAETIEPELAQDSSVEYGFLLHDVGKIGIPDSILLKPGPLTASERRLMETHARLGEQMLGGVGFLRGDGLSVVRSHHERWDGTGYPDGVGGEEIPLGARVFALADTLDAMTSHRPYRLAQSWSTAREEIVAQSGSQFDPAVVDAFREREADLQEVRREFSLAA